MTKTRKRCIATQSLIFCFCLIFQDVKAQYGFWRSTNAYLGQKPPGDVPTVFAKSLLKDSGIVLGRVGFSADGKGFYYSYARHWFDDNGAGTKEIRFEGGRWQRPKIIAEGKTNPAFSKDDRALYLGSGNGVVWILDRLSSGWSKPKLWLDRSFGLYNFQATKTGAFYAGSNGTDGTKADWNKYDLSQIIMAGPDTSVRSLGKPLNTDGFDGDFFIAPDESYIIISVLQNQDYDSELWISFQKTDGTWSKPVSLGEHINNGLAHRFGQYVSPNGKYLFYTRGTSEKDCDVYWVRFDNLLRRLKAQSR